MSKKYNRTYHLPWSQGLSNDDKVIDHINDLLHQPIVITEKIDGSNTSLEKDNCFARTHSGPPKHPSFDGLKSLHANVKYKIPDNVQLFGEWVYALHSIAYDELPNYFLLFNVRINNIWSSWEEVELWAQEIGVPTVPVLYKGIISSEKELQLITSSFMNQKSCFGPNREGIVIRVANEFNDENFQTYVGKVVRKNHINPGNDHWIHQEIIKNKLKKE